MVYRIFTYDEETKKWIDTDEGPWRTRDGAQEFARTEVGVKYRIMEIVEEW